ncbi:unnamed protein product [Adineta steineri]|uniref:Protein kinase domain-containing protein n=1 Tax=Adineta steineri TaxID=433720 RepID=A0A815LHQ2_9BILA|nr:unnamed protein product [Adineta steineri]
MCEDTKNHLWALQDILGHGATSQVYKAYNKFTGELVAAKVYQVSSNSRSPHGGDGKANQNRDYRPILDRELDILKSADHENIVRYIALEPVMSSDAPHTSDKREALLIEYCNGGSLNNVLELPENRYGLIEVDYMLLFKQLTNALKYLHDKNTIHRDIKPDNIMLSININGERTYKLADLGVARLINEGENAFTSLVGTEEYIHPELYRAAIRDDRTDVLRTALQTRVDFPFEVDLWSLGVTLFQCATGELPFQPFAGTRKDRAGMKRILDTKPTGCISGVENTPGGEIQWSKTLPASCRLSVDLKQRLEALLPRLLESNRNKLMTFKEFFQETDRIFNLMPIYYLNLKRFTLTCNYFEPTQMITELYNKLHQQNNGDHNEEYYCLFQNVSYPISKKNPITIKQFCEQLPIPTSRETPLVFYTFSPLKSNDQYIPYLHIPTVKPIRQFNDVAAAYDWSKDMVGLFIYIKNQLIDYQHILQTAQCSTTIMQQHLKTNLLEFLCTIRSKLIVFRAIEELKNILDQIDSNTSSQTTSSSNISMNSNNGNNSSLRTQSTGGGEGAPSIGFSHLFNNAASSSENSLSPVMSHRSPSASPMQLIQQSIRIYLRSYLQPYEQLKKCEQDILDMIEKEFSGQLGMLDDQQPFKNTLWLSQFTKIYSSWIHRADKHLKDLMDLHESFRKDRLLNTYNRLQSDSHFRRRKNLEELHERYAHFANDECYSNLLQGFKDYNEWIKKRSNIIDKFYSIQQSYEKQCEDIMNYIEMIDDLRTVVYKNIRELGGPSSSSSSSTNEYLQAPMPSTILSHPQQFTENDSSHSHQLVSGSEEEEMEVNDNIHSSNKTLMKKIRGTTKKTIQQAEEGFIRLDHVIKQLRTSIQKK